MAKAQRRKSAKVSVYLKRKSALSRDDIFEVEKNPPPYSGRWNPERGAVIDKIDETLKTVTVGQAFIIPIKYRHTVAKHLRNGYPADVFRMQAISKNPDMLRVYRLAYTKKK